MSDIAPPAYVMQITVPGVTESECLALGAAIATLLTRDSDLRCIPADLVTPAPAPQPEPTEDEAEAAALVSKAEGREIAL